MQRKIWNNEAASFRLDMSRPDHLAPFLSFFGDELSKVGGRARQHCTAQKGKMRLELGIGESGVDLLVEFSDDLSGRTLRRADAVPIARLIARYESAYAWDSGSSRHRVAVVTASARNLPALMYWMDEVAETNITCTCPPSRSISAGAVPRYGT